MLSNLEGWCYNLVFSSDPGPAANPACYGTDTGMNATAGQVKILSNIIIIIGILICIIIRRIFIHSVQVVDCDPEQFEGNVACYTMVSHCPMFVTRYTAERTDSAKLPSHGMRANGNHDDFCDYNDFLKCLITR